MLAFAALGSTPARGQLAGYALGATTRDAVIDGVVLDGNEVLVFAEVRFDPTLPDQEPSPTSRYADGGALSEMTVTIFSPPPLALRVLRCHPVSAYVVDRPDGWYGGDGFWFDSQGCVDERGFPGGWVIVGFKDGAGTTLASDAHPEEVSLADFAGVVLVMGGRTLFSAEVNRLVYRPTGDGGAPACGLGPELALGIPMLRLGLRRARRRNCAA